MPVSPWVASWVAPGGLPGGLLVTSWVRPGRGAGQARAGLGAAWHRWWARHLHGLGGLTCMFVISLTFGDVWGWLVSRFFLPSDLVLCGSEGLVDTLVLEPSVADEGRWCLHRPHTAAGEREPATPPRSGRETGPGSRSPPGLSAGGDPPGSGCHSYPGPRS